MTTRHACIDCILAFIAQYSVHLNGMPLAIDLMFVCYATILQPLLGFMRLIR